MTALANRRGGEEALAREVARARRTGSPLSLVLFDIDRFKSINDDAGHAVGDRVLRGISEILSASQRGSDLAMRWGGEEFLVLLPDVGLAGARIFAERVRENVQNLIDSPTRAASRCRRACRSWSATKIPPSRSRAPTPTSIARKPAGAIASKSITRKSAALIQRAHSVACVAR